MHTEFVNFRSSRVHYRRWGTGDQLLFCFHGYGESADTFAFLEAAIGGDFTILAPDMPFHGQTEWKEGCRLEPEDLLHMLGEMAAGLPGIGGRWWLMGYSMGGRVALSLLEKVPAKIGKLILLAPDGLRLNPWYWLATQTWAGNHFFRWTMRHPGWFFSFLRIGDKWGLVNQSVYKFTVHYIGNEAARQELYTRWTTLRGFRPGRRVIRAIIRQQEIPVRLLFGRYDRIIRWESGERFRQAVGPWCRLVTLPMGHHLLQPGNGEAILALLKE